MHLGWAAVPLALVADPQKGSRLYCGHDRVQAALDQGDDSTTYGHDPPEEHVTQTCAATARGPYFSYSILSTTIEPDFTSRNGWPFLTPTVP